MTVDRFLLVRFLQDERARVKRGSADILLCCLSVTIDALGAIDEIDVNMIIKFNEINIRVILPCWLC